MFKGRFGSKKNQELVDDYKELSDESSQRNYRDDFGKVTGELIVAMADVSEEKKNKVLDFQGNLTAIAISEKDKERDEKTNLYRVFNAQEAQELVESKGVSQEILEQGKELVKSQQGVPRDVPLFGDLMVKSGLVSKDAKNALMEVQAAEKTAQAAEGKVNPQVEEAFNQVDANKPMFKRDFIGKFKDDPKSLVIAQATDHLAELISGYINAKGGQDNVSEVVRDSKDALKVLAIDSYEMAADSLSKASRDEMSGLSGEAAFGAGKVAAKLKEKAPDFSKVAGIQMRPETAVGVAMKRAEVGLKEITDEYKGKDDEQSQVFGQQLEEIAAKRLEQASSVERMQLKSQGASRT